MRPYFKECCISTDLKKYLKFFYKIFVTKIFVLRQKPSGSKTLTFKNKKEKLKQKRVVTTLLRKKTTTTTGKFQVYFENATLYCCSAVSIKSLMVECSMLLVPPLEMIVLHKRRVFLDAACMVEVSWTWGGGYGIKDHIYVRGSQIVNCLLDF